MFWANVRRWARVAWVCRVSVTSCVLGFILFVFVVQARDLFLEFPSLDAATAGDLKSYATMAWYAARFGFLLLVFWAVPVHAAARLGLNRTEWLKSPYGPAEDPVDLEVARKAFLQPVVWLPRILGALCFIGAAASVAYTIYDLLPLNVPRATTDWVHLALGSYLVSIVIFGVLFAIYAIGRRKWYGRLAQSRRFAARGLRVPEQPTVARGRESAGVVDRIDHVFVVGLFLLLLAILAIPSLLDFFPRLLLLPVLLGAWVPVLGWLGREAHATKVPLITLAILVLVIVTYVVGDNHNVVPKQEATSQINIADAVKQWRKANACDTDVRNCPSPIIVASAGGASRAAFLTASVMGLLLDASCLDDAHLAADKGSSEPPPACSEAPAFGGRLFAISSVSGGSLGAITYARAYLDGQPHADRKGYAAPCKQGIRSELWFGDDPARGWRTCLEAVASEDFLSPVFAGLGFRDVFTFVGRLADDIAHRLAPSLVGKIWPDRGQRLEEAWSRAYERFVPDPTPDMKGGFRAEFTSLAPVARDDVPWRPLLLLNATSVETGTRVIASHLYPTYLSGPIKSCTRIFSDAYDTDELDSGDAAKGESSCATQKTSLLGLTVAGAAHNSARFPVVSPAGNLMPPWLQGRSAGHVVDGGYFENYGALTAFDLVDTLRWEYHLAPLVILITNDLSDTLDEHEDQPAEPKASASPPPPWRSARPKRIKAPPEIFGEVAAVPIDTVLSTRSGHGSTAIHLLRGLLDPAVYPRDEMDAPKPAVDRSCFGLQAASETTSNAESSSEPCFVHIGVVPQKTPESGTVRDISMSWWLSKPVQSYLDRQLADERNLRGLELVCTVVARGRVPGSSPADDARRQYCVNRLRKLTSLEAH